MHRFAYLPCAKVLEQLHDRLGCSSAEPGCGRYKAHIDIGGSSTERLAHMRRENVSHHVSGNRVQATFRYDDCASGLGLGVVFRDHGVDPRNLARAIQVVSSGFCAGGHDGLAVEHERAHGRDDEAGPESEGCELIFLDLAYFDICVLRIDVSTSIIISGNFVSASFAPLFEVRKIPKELTWLLPIWT